MRLMCCRQSALCLLAPALALSCPVQISNDLLSSNYKEAWFVFKLHNRCLDTIATTSQAPECLQVAVSDAWQGLLRALHCTWQAMEHQWA